MDVMITGPLLLVAAVSSTNNIEAQRSAATAAYKQIGLESFANNITDKYINKTMEEKLVLILQANQLLINRSIAVKFNF